MNECMEEGGISGQTSDETMSVGWQEKQADGRAPRGKRVHMQTLEAAACCGSMRCASIGEGRQGQTTVGWHMPAPEKAADR